ncbi:SigE family RNA polymerase sigma factor [Sporichthya brevicatena]|uniref:SigE family RNA polymerase sigma factor n=1 Tax=Sporichthya brevicatena TaxID=171442 RepID=A0ABP3RSI5_9ACTN
MGSERNAEAEFAAFVLSTQRRLRRVAYLVCGDWHRAEDIVQTALAQVYARWDRIRREDGPEGYAHRAVVNAAIDERRRPWRRERATDALPDRAAPPDDDGITPAVLAALATLPRRQRAVVVLRYVEDLDVEQTAALLGISTGTVKSQAAKGLASLRAHLSGVPADARTGE